MINIPVRSHVSVTWWTALSTSAPKQRRLKMFSTGTDPLREHGRWLPEGQTIFYRQDSVREVLCQMNQMSRSLQAGRISMATSEHRQVCQTS